MQRVIGIVDDMWTQLKQVQQASVCVLTKLPGEAASSVENDVTELKDRLEK